MFLRLVFIALFALLWWHTFPFVNGHDGLRQIEHFHTLRDWPPLLCATIYPTYLLVYEVFAATFAWCARGSTAS